MRISQSTQTIILRKSNRVISDLETISIELFSIKFDVKDESDLILFILCDI